MSVFLVYDVFLRLGITQKYTHVSEFPKSTLTYLIGLITRSLNNEYRKMRIALFPTDMAYFYYSIIQNTHAF
jgi:hypothetical protein